MTASATITIIVPGPPVAWARAGSKGSRRWTPRKSAAWVFKAENAAWISMGSASPIKGPVVMSVTAIFDPPESWPKWKRAAALGGDVVPSTRPDLDNIVKIAADGIGGIVYEDDAQIVGIEASKKYGKSPCVVITVSKVAGISPSVAKNPHRNKGGEECSSKKLSVAA